MAAAFGMSDRVNVVEQVLGEYNNLKKLNDFLEGKSKHKHVFVYYQRPDVINDANELVDAKGAVAERFSRSCLTARIPRPGDAKLMITTGEHEDVRIKNRAAPWTCIFGDESVRKGVLLAECGGLQARKGSESLRKHLTVAVAGRRTWLPTVTCSLERWQHLLWRV